jgi:peptide/nickel transport system permease protein
MTTGSTTPGDGSAEALANGSRPKRTLAQNLNRFARRKPLGAISAVVLILLALTALFAPVIATQDPLFQGRSTDRLQAPSAEHWMGTDNLSRDVFSRVVYGARISLQVGFFAIGLGTVFGLTIGLMSGYLGGKLDLVVQRFVDVLMGFPFIVLAMLLVVALGASLWNVGIALSVAIVPRVVRLSRSSTLSVKEEMYVLAAQTMGVSLPRMVFIHILPNTLGPVFVLATGALGGVIVAEAGLAFLGLGIPPPTPSWGGMLNVGARGYMEAAPWMVIFPGLALSVVVFTFSLLGDALRDVLDPRLRRGGS